MSKPVLKIQTLSVYISTTLVLLLLGTMGLLYIGGQAVSKKIQESFRMTVIVDKETSDAEIKKIQSRIEAKEYTLGCKYISKEQIVQEVEEELNYNPLELLGENPYEPEFELSLKQEYCNGEAMAKIKKELESNKAITLVRYHEGHVDTVNSNIQKASIFLLALLVMLGTISWSLIGNLVRLSIYSKRFMLHTMKLVGATWGFIRRPFIVGNMRIGLVSGIVANAILGFALYMIQQKEPAIATLLPAEQLAALSLLVILFGITICALCAFFSVNRFLRMRNNDLYFI